VETETKEVELKWYCALRKSGDSVCFQSIAGAFNFNAEAPPRWVWFKRLTLVILKQVSETETVTSLHKWHVMSKGNEGGMIDTSIFTQIGEADETTIENLKKAWFPNDIMLARAGDIAKYPKIKS